MSMSPDEMVARAKEIAVTVHADQTDRGGAPYIQHVEYVANQVRQLGPLYETVAWLHDTVEDAKDPSNLRQRIAFQFPAEILTAVDCVSYMSGWSYAGVTRKPETYLEYILRIAGNDIARQVKLADLRHNMDIARIPNPTEKDHDRTRKYVAAYDLLMNAVRLETFK